MTKDKKEIKKEEKPKIVSIKNIVKKPEIKKEIKKEEKPKVENRGRPKKIIKKLDVTTRKEIPDNTLPENTGWSTKQKVGFWAGVTIGMLGLGLIIYKIKVAIDLARLEDEKEKLENEKDNPDIPDEEFIDEPEQDLNVEKNEL